MKEALNHYHENGVVPPFKRQHLIEVPLYLLYPPGGEAFLRENQGRDKVQDLEDDTFWEITQTF